MPRGKRWRPDHHDHRRLLRRSPPGRTHRRQPDLDAPACGAGTAPMTTVAYCGGLPPGGRTGGNQIWMRPHAVPGLRQRPGRRRWVHRRPPQRTAGCSARRGPRGSRWAPHSLTPTLPAETWATALGASAATSTNRWLFSSSRSMDYGNCAPARRRGTARVGPLPAGRGSQSICRGALSLLVD